MKKNLLEFLEEVKPTVFIPPVPTAAPVTPKQGKSVHRHHYETCCFKFKFVINYQHIY